MCKKALFLLAGVCLLLLPDVIHPREVELIYDDGDPDWVINGFYGLVAAVRMSPPSGTWKVKTARFLLHSGDGKVRVLDDASGSPGQDLFPGVEISSGNPMDWFDVDLSPYNIKVKGDFYVALEGNDETNQSNFLLGRDPHGNQRSWLYAPSQGYWRLQQENTFFIRAVVTDEPAVEEEIYPTPPPDLGCDPNPFTRTTTIRYTKEEAGPVTLRVWDAGGRCIRTLVKASKAPGTYLLEWNGRDGKGDVLASGVYFLKMDTPRSRMVRKVVLIR